jgi:hypothetical protein
MLGIRQPGFTVCGSSTQARRSAVVLGTTPDAIVLLLARCVRSGPNFPMAGVPLMVWQFTQDRDSNTSLSWTSFEPAPFDPDC